MKFLLSVFLLLNIAGSINAQNKTIYTANSEWVRINTEVFAKVIEPLPSKEQVERSNSLVSIQDYFSLQSNPYGWRTTELSGVTYRRGNGVYKITTSSRVLNVVSVIDAKCELDSVDFILQCTMSSKGGNTPSAGLVWGYNDKDNYMAFRLNSKGEAAFIFMNSGVNEESNFKLYPGVYNTLDNVLAVKKKGTKLEFYINDKLALSSIYGYIQNSKIGFITSDNEVVFKNFMFNQISN